MLNRVPLGAAGWIMTDDTRQAIAVAQRLLQVLFPHTRTAALAASTLRQDEQLLRLWISRPSLIFPPTGQGSHSNFWCIGGRPHLNSPAIVRQIVDPVRNCFAHRFLRAIMHIHIVRLLSPGLTCILEVATSLLFLGIDTADRPVGALKALLLPLNVVKLLRPLRMRCTRLQILDSDPQRETQVTEQATYRWWAHAMTQVTQTLAQLPHPTAHPRLLTPGVCRRFGLYQPVHGRF